MNFESAQLELRRVRREVKFSELQDHSTNLHGAAEVMILDFRINQIVLPTVE